MHGGAIFSSGSIVSVTDTWFDSNEAEIFGGGLALWGATVGTFSGNRLTTNKAGHSGGGVFAWTGSVVSSVGTDYEASVCQH